MILVALLFPIFCQSQSEERVTTIETKIKKQILKIASLEKNDNATLKKTIKSTPLTPRAKYLYGLLGAMITWSLTEYAFTVGFERDRFTFLKSFCRFTIVLLLIWPKYRNYALEAMLNEWTAMSKKSANLKQKA